MAKPKEEASPHREKREAVRGMFNRIAPTYDLLNRLLSLGIDRLWRRATIDRMALHDKAIVLDLACGTGDLSQVAARRGVMSILAVDPSREMLLRARSKMRFGNARIYLVESFGEEIPLKSGLCTHAMIAFGIRNVQERNKAFAEVYRILRPGGLFAVLEFTPMDRKLVSAGFNLYFHKILPAIGGMISRDRQAYQYLPESVAKFITSDGLVAEAGEAGFTLREKKVFALGIATCLILEKSE